MLRVVQYVRDSVDFHGGDGGMIAANLDRGPLSSGGAVGQICRSMVLK